MNQVAPIVAIFLWVAALISLPASAWASKTTVIKTEDQRLVVDIKYPQGFANKHINQTIADFIHVNHESILKSNQEDNLPADLPGKNALYIDYKTMFSNSRILSLFFTISTNARGAAHPSNTVQTFNFLDGQELSLNDLFLPQSDALKKISNFCQDFFVKQKRSDAQWIAEGTKPTADNYKRWYFTKSGIVVVFDTYQVEAYVYGPQKVTLSRSMIQSWLKPEIARAVWGNS